MNHEPLENSPTNVLCSLITLIKVTNSPDKQTSTHCMVVVITIDALAEASLKLDVT